MNNSTNNICSHLGLLPVNIRSQFGDNRSTNLASMKIFRLIDKSLLWWLLCCFHATNLSSNLNVICCPNSKATLITSAFLHIFLANISRCYDGGCHGVTMVTSQCHKTDRQTNRSNNNFIDIYTLSRYGTVLADMILFLYQCSPQGKAS